MSELKGDSWSTRPEAGNIILIRLFAKTSMLLGRSLLRPVIYLIAFFYLCFAAKSRQASTHFLSKALGRPPSIIDIYRHFLYFASVTHDRLYFLSKGFHAFDITIQGQDLIDQSLNSSHGVLLYGAHYGSFEVLRYTAHRYRNLNISVLMYPNNSQMLLEVFKTISQDFSDCIIPLGSINTMLMVRDRLNNGQMVGLLADRSINSEPGSTHEFLGTHANFPISPFKLQGIFKTPAIFIAGVYEGGNRYSIHFRDLNPDQIALTPQQLQMRYVQTLENFSRTNPFNWFNFYNFWGAQE